MTPFDQGRPAFGARRKPLRAQSAKRKKQNVVRRANVLARWGTNPRCEGCGPLALLGISAATTGCDGRATDAHEIVSRARGGSITDVSNMKALGRACHTFVTENPDIAEAAGLALPSPRCLSAPRAIP